MNKKPQAAEGSEEKDRQFVAALARGLDVLRCFTQSAPELGTTDIARMTGLPQPTVWRLCHTLQQQGYLVPTGSNDKLRPGIPALSLGFAAIAGMPTGDIAKADMQAIAARYQGAVSLSVRDGHSMIYLQRCLGSDITLRDVSIGSRVSVVTSASGWAYMAGMPAGEREALFDELARTDKRWPLLSDRIVEALEGFAQTGHVINRGVGHPQINAVGVPVKSADGAVRFALSSGGLNHLYDDEHMQKIAAELKALAGQLEPVAEARG